MKKGMLFEAVAVLLLIALAFLLYAMVTTGGSPGQWAVSGVLDRNDSYAYGNLLIGDNGTVYAIDGENIRAIDHGGHIVWNVTIPSVLYGMSVDQWRGLKAITDNGTLYVVLVPVDYSRGELVAISPEGRFLWGKAYSPDDFPTDLSVKAGRLYTINPGRVIAYDKNGTEIWHESDIYYMPAIDENGTAYMIRGIPGDSVSQIVARDGSGGLAWNRDIRDYGLGGMVAHSFWQPLYNNHTIYVIVQDGLIALDQKGNVEWKKPYYGIKVLESFDDRGNLYLLNGSRAFYVSPDGSEHTITDSYDTTKLIEAIDAANDTLYTWQIVSPPDDNESAHPYGRLGYHDVEDVLNGSRPSIPEAIDNRTVDQLDAIRVHAYSIKSGKSLWNYTLPIVGRIVTLSGSNYANIIDQPSDAEYIRQDNMVSPAEWYRSRNITAGSKLVTGWSYADLMISDGVLYVSSWSYNYEVPAFFGRSKYAYAGGIYALDRNGTLLWYRQPGSKVTVMDVRNGTIYYGTNDGRMFSAKTDTAAGFALTAAAYLFIRFVLAGAITRARSRIDRNGNRNSVLGFIVENPGSGLYEICRGLGMNKGTVRYHLLILGINHRITSFKSDDKYVRYFTNSGAYSREQQLILSIMRRSGIKKALNALLATPGLTNAEVAEALGMRETATIRYLKELAEKGVVEKDQMTGGRLAYFIRAEYREPVAFAIDRLDNTGRLRAVGRQE